MHDLTDFPLDQFYQIVKQQRRTVLPGKLSEQNVENFTIRGHFYKNKVAFNNFQVSRYPAVIAPLWLQIPPNSRPNWLSSGCVIVIFLLELIHILSKVYRLTDRCCCVQNCIKCFRCEIGEIVRYLHDTKIFLSPSQSCYCMDRARNLPGLVPNIGLTVFLISYKSFTLGVVIAECAMAVLLPHNSNNNSNDSPNNINNSTFM